MDQAIAEHFDFLVGKVAMSETVLLRFCTFAMLFALPGVLQVMKHSKMNGTLS